MIISVTRAAGQGTIGWVVFRPLPGVDSQSLSNAVDREFLVDLSSTTTDTERTFNRSFVAQLGNVALMTSLVVGASLFTLLMIVVNTVMISMRERRKDIAVLKVLGFSPARIVSIYFVEVLIVASVAGIAGLAAAFGAINTIGPMLTQIAPGMSLSIEVLTIATLLIAVTSLVAVAAPAVFVLRMPAISSLQRS